MELRGILEQWHDDKGFGFIRPESGGAKLFVHISVVRGDSRPQQGDNVLYLLGRDAQGRARASHMRHEALSLDRPAMRRQPTKARVTSEPGSRGIEYLALKLSLFIGLLLLPVYGAWLAY